MTLPIWLFVVLCVFAAIGLWFVVIVLYDVLRDRFESEESILEKTFLVAALPLIAGPFVFALIGLGIEKFS